MKLLRTLPALLAFAAVALLTAQEAGKVETQNLDPTFVAGEESLIRVDVSRVPLLFTVTDKKNRFITDLEKEDFEVRDNGEKQVDPASSFASPTCRCASAS